MDEPVNTGKGPTRQLESMASNVFSEITEEIIAALEKGDMSWTCPWIKTGPPKRFSGMPFTGINKLKLSLEGRKKGYLSPFWLTVSQGRRCGSELLPDQEPTLAVRVVQFPDRNPRASLSEGRIDEFTEPDEIATSPRMFPYEVFNMEQFSTVPPRFRAESWGDMKNRPDDHRPELKEFFGLVGARIIKGGDIAAYIPSADLVTMPDFRRFNDADSFYGTLAHELVHWSGHERRMERDLTGRFGDQRYAMEELIAELGSAFVMAVLGTSGQLKEGHAAYIQSWIKVLKNDHNAVYSAASHAQRAADYLTVAGAPPVVDELSSRDIGYRDGPVMYFDRVTVGLHTLVVAIGVNIDGQKQLLGVELDDEDANCEPPSATRLLKRLLKRGLSSKLRRLFVTGSSPVLREAIRTVFGNNPVIQRCRASFIREVVAGLSSTGIDTKDDALSGKNLSKMIREAFGLGHDEGKKFLRELSDELRILGAPATAEMLEASLPELFVVDELELHKALRKSLSTTHVIRQAKVGLRHQICGIPWTKDGEIVVKWAVASFLASEKKFRRVAGWDDLATLWTRLNGVTASLGSVADSGA